MKEIVYRIIFKKLYSKSTNDFIQYVTSEFDFSKKKAEHILNSPPAILWDTPSKHIVKSALKNFKAMNANVSVHKVIKDERLSFHIDQWQLKWISKLLNMSLRAGVDTCLLYVIVQPENKGDELIPLTGRENEIEKRFRESDSVYAIDDNKILFLGFTTDETGLQILIPKVIKAVKKIVRKDAIIKIGEAIFPRDGYSFYELIDVLQKRINAYATPREKLESPSLKKEAGGESKFDNNSSGIDSIYSNILTMRVGCSSGN